MALGGTLLPSISTFASGPSVKSKSIGSANLVSSMWSRPYCAQNSHWHQRICSSLCTVFSSVSLPCYYGHSRGLTPRSTGACTSLHRLLQQARREHADRGHGRLQKYILMHNIKIFNIHNGLFNRLQTDCKNHLIKCSLTWRFPLQFPWEWE